MLVDGGVDAPSVDDLWRAYQVMVLYSWVGATATASMGSRWQPAEVGFRGMSQATTACADLETIEAVRAVL